VKGFFRRAGELKELRGGGEIGQRISSEKNRINQKRSLNKKEGFTKREE
jgi:hypothetical protein